MAVLATEFRFKLVDKFSFPYDVEEDKITEKLDQWYSEYRFENKVDLEIKGTIYSDITTIYSGHEFVDESKIRAEMYGCTLSRILAVVLMFPVLLSLFYNLAFRDEMFRYPGCDTYVCNTAVKTARSQGVTGKMCIVVREKIGINRLPRINMYIVC
mmetsp:Transcript_12973/g.15748  ORF Transcript_12973/g.15748 Transcript_12973/m.15748 type:complete len:156 (+) Transcript_12973:154-621(+)